MEENGFDPEPAEGRKSKPSLKTEETGRKSKTSLKIEEPDMSHRKSKAELSGKKSKSSLKFEEPEASRRKSKSSVKHEGHHGRKSKSSLKFEGVELRSKPSIKPGEEPDVTELRSKSILKQETDWVERYEGAETTRKSKSSLKFEGAELKSKQSIKPGEGPVGSQEEEDGKSSLQPEGTEEDRKSSLRSEDTEGTEGQRKSSLQPDATDEKRKASLKPEDAAVVTERKNSKKDLSVSFSNLKRASQDLAGDSPADVERRASQQPRKDSTGADRKGSTEGAGAGAVKPPAPAQRVPAPTKAPAPAGKPRAGSDSKAARTSVEDDDDDDPFGPSKSLDNFGSGSYASLDKLDDGGNKVPKVLPKTGWWLNKDTVLFNMRYEPAYDSRERLMDMDIIGLYFANYLHQQTRLFTSYMAKFYKIMKKNGWRIEIIFISMDDSEKDAQEFCKEMGDWLALPWPDQIHRRMARNDCNVNKFPKLVIYKNAGEGIQISDRGIADLAERAEGAWFHWSSLAKWAKSKTRPKDINPAAGPNP